jgi:hypothetical protein
MLGSEYNWLIVRTAPSHSEPRVSLARTGMLTLLVAAFCLLCAALRGLTFL